MEETLGTNANGNQGMIVIHIESGLGNQMLSYCELLALKKMNPREDFFLETIVFDIPECNEVTCQWNGFELDKIFHIQTPNIRSIVSETNWNKLMGEILGSRFWQKNMNYPVYFTKAFANIGIEVENTWGDFEEAQYWGDQKDSWLKAKIKHSLPYMHLQMWKQRRVIPQELMDCTGKLFFESDKNLFAGQKLLFKYKGSGIERIEQEIRASFAFPEIVDKRNKEAAKEISSCNSVAIHARRGDMLGFNYPCYATGYFKRAVNFIRNKVEQPVFYIFCDPGSVGWAKENERVLGLDFSKDVVRFVDWNKSTDSFRDMQLMTKCKHQIITNSSFGWWGAWLNQNPGKITISPDYKINTTHCL